MQRRLWAAGIVLACGADEACAPAGFVCPAIGYTNTAHISLSEPRPGLDLWMCDPDGCDPRPAARDTDLDQWSLTGNSATGWIANFTGGYSSAQFLLTDTAGAVVAEGSLEVEWIRVNGTERCGGNQEADIEIPL